MTTTTHLDTARRRRTTVAGRRRTASPTGRRGVAFVAAVAVVVTSGLALAAASPASAVPVKNPVIVIGGMTGSFPINAGNYRTLVTRIQAQGHQTFQFTNADGGFGDIHANAGRLATYADNVRSQTGATQVDIVAHSQGGLIARDYIKYIGGATKVGSLIMLSTTNHGTSSSTPFNCFFLPGCVQQGIGSTYLNGLNAGDDSIGNVRYINIATSQDTVVTPYTSSFLDEADGNITNVTVQTQCPGIAVTHATIITHPAVADGVADALRRAPVVLNCGAT